MRAHTHTHACTHRRWDQVFWFHPVFPSYHLLFPSHCVNTPHTFSSCCRDNLFSKHAHTHMSNSFDINYFSIIQPLCVLFQVFSTFFLFTCSWGMHSDTPSGHAKLKREEHLQANQPANKEAHTKPTLTEVWDRVSSSSVKTGLRFHSLWDNWCF